MEAFDGSDTDVPSFVCFRLLQYLYVSHVSLPPFQLSVHVHTAISHDHQWNRGSNGDKQICCSPSDIGPSRISFLDSRVSQRPQLAQWGWNLRCGCTEYWLEGRVFLTQTILSSLPLLSIGASEMYPWMPGPDRCTCVYPIATFSNLFLSLCLVLLSNFDLDNLIVVAIRPLKPTSPTMQGLFGPLVCWQK